MADYIELPLVDDSDALVELGVDYLQTSIDGFVARPGNVETVLLEANAQIGAEVIAQASLVAPVIFAYLGQNLLGIGLRPAEPARADAAVLFAADAVVTVPAGALVSVPHPDGNLYAFTVDADVVSPVGGGTVATTITALEPGAAANGAVGTAELVEVLDGVDAISVAAAAAGGVDEETEDEYLDRLTDAMTILAPRPILPEDHATMARQVDGVGRALALDLLQPPASSGGRNTPTGGTAAPWGPEPNGATNVPRCTTVAITAEDGTAPPGPLMQEILDVLDAHREVNFLNYVIPPSYTTIDVRATVRAYPGYAPADVKAAAQESLADWLDPGLWGGSPAAAVSGQEEWAQDTYARIYEAVDYLNRADGVHYVVSVELRKAGGAWGAVDVALAGLAPLPLAGDLSAITVQVP